MVPSELPKLLWGKTLKDLRFKVRIRIGDKTSELAHNYQSLLLTGQHLLGGKKDKPSKNELKDAIPIQSFAHLQQIVQQNK